MSENKVYKSIAELVGNTPLVEIGNYSKNNNLEAKVLAKLEYFNPSGSVKDRAALAMILEAEKSGKIKPGDTIIDFTSGNTGIALAAYANALGYKFAVVLQPGVSVERTQILKAYGTTFLEFKDIPGVLELIQNEGLVFEKFYALIQKYADEHGYYYINQGRNHEITTFTLPHVTMTALTYKDTKTLHRAIKIGTVVVAIWLLGLNGLCFITKYTFAEGTLATADLAIPSLAVKVMPAWAAGLVLAGVSGAVQSSMGGMVVSLAGTIVSDIYKNIFNKEAKPETIKKLNIAAILVVSIVIFLLASNPPELLAKLITYSTGGLTVVFFHTVLLGLFWKRANEYGAISGVISGILLYLLIDQGILPISLGFNACIMATLLSTVIAALVSLVTPKTPYGIIKTWFGKIQ